MEIITHYLPSSSFIPIAVEHLVLQVMIHQSHPLDYIAFDRTMQDIVYKLVPSLEKDEYKKERDFYAEKGMPCPKDLEEENHEEEDEVKKEEEAPPEPGSTMDYHRSLDCSSSPTLLYQS